MCYYGIREVKVLEKMTKWVQFDSKTGLKRFGGEVAASKEILILPPL